MADEEECISKGLKIEGETESLIKKWQDSEEKLNDFVSSFPDNEDEFLKKAPTFINELTNSTTIIENIVKKLNEVGHQEICCEHYREFYEWLLQNRPREFKGDADIKALQKPWFGFDNAIAKGPMQQFFEEFNSYTTLGKPKKKDEDDISNKFNENGNKRKLLFIDLLNILIKELKMFIEKHEEIKIPEDADEDFKKEDLISGDKDNMKKVCGDDFGYTDFLFGFESFKKLCITNLKKNIRKTKSQSILQKYDNLLNRLVPPPKKGGKRRRKKSRKRRRKTRRKKSRKRRRKSRRKRKTKRRHRKR